ncbi:TRAP transporter small permease subunit [Oceanibacterium hippocampi]|uniref:TRAP transporter small permease protein n=1 Tax=Oceanibacterium hippocampi TaxID=745714 RepID=A0A1Y5T9K2_9PROT|nr:TRAP transporter small permease [Oceanibacterium hippocampi]SLN58963.1 Tripartite ATP-independent periplasmic transporters, DctQ component [Oceanibacterium hippocampi]
MTFLRALERGLDRLYLLSGYLAALFLVVLGVLIFISIASRALGVYMAGLTAYSGYAMIASTFLAFAYTLKSDAHIRVELFINRAGIRLRKGMEIWCHVVAAGFGSYFAFYSIRMVWVSYRFQERSEGSDAILLWIPQLAMALGTTIFAISLVHSLVRVLITPAAEIRRAPAQEIGH